MAEYLCLEGEMRFRLKPGAGIDSLLSAFSTFFEGTSRWRRIIQARRYVADTLLPGKVGIVILQKTYFYRHRLASGAVGAILLFYTNRGGKGRAIVLGFIPLSTAYQNLGRSVADWELLAKKLREEILDTFFEERCRRLIQLENYPIQLNDAVINPEKEGEEGEAEPTNQLEAPIAESQPEVWRTPIRFCPNCDAVTAIAEAKHCWNCSSKLEEKPPGAPTTHRERGSTPPIRGSIHVFQRYCAVCRSGFENEELIAWCPPCGAAAHRTHMLEWLHVKGECPACSQHLTAQEMSEQLR